MADQSKQEVLLRTNGEALTHYLRSLSELELDQLLSQHAFRDRLGLPSESLWDFILRKEQLRQQTLSNLNLG